MGIGCTEYRELILASIAGRLDGQERALVEAHMETCQACRELAAEQLAVWAALDKWGAPAEPADFNRRLFARMEMEETGWRKWLKLFRPPMVRRGLPVAAAAALAFVAIIVGLDQPEQARMPAEVSMETSILKPDQVESALEDMQLLRDLYGIAPPDSPTM